jgi:cyclohexa-1,5-dienecarbonyl-CoA hydratase
MTTSVRVRVVDEAAGRWRRLVLDAPPGNLLSAAMVELMTGAVADAGTVPALKWLTLEGAGGQFSYGASIPEHMPEPMPQVLTATHALIRALLSFPSPTAALVDGRCLGGGFELALACDDILASGIAEFGLPEIALAAFPPVGAALLPVRIGAARASRAVVTGDVQSAAYWHEAGLVSRVADGVPVVEAARIWFERYCAPRSAAALEHAARAAREAWLPTVERAIASNERRYLEELLPHADAAEGIAAWMGKRPPVWRDR